MGVLRSWFLVSLVACVLIWLSSGSTSRTYSRANHARLAEQISESHSGQGAHRVLNEAAAQQPLGNALPIDELAVPGKSNKVGPNGIGIPRLHQLAVEAHARKTKNQSKKLAVAEREYIKRYSMKPPIGFDKWFAYAIKNKSPIMDDFDELMESLRWFRSFREDSCDLTSPTKSLKGILPFCIRNGSLTVEGRLATVDEKQTAKSLKDLVRGFAQELPNMCFDINTLDYARQLLPLWKQEPLLNGTYWDSCENHKFWKAEKKSIWRQLVASCPPTSLARLGVHARYRNQVAPVLNWNDLTDLCDRESAPPSGMVRSPLKFLRTEAPRPILSGSKLSTFTDVLFPSRLRWQSYDDNAKGNTTEDKTDSTPWEEKNDTVRWRGSSAGGYAPSEFPGNWRKFQRHRMVLLGNISSTVPIQDPDQVKKWLDVRFTSIEGCDADVCAEIADAAPTTPLQPMNETFGSKIVLDMDGDGLSDKLYPLLQSKSAVMRQGLIREWHDSRLIPWLHYIPLSMEMDELEDILHFFYKSGTEGDEILRRIGAEGRAWTQSALRKQDMKVYMFRLLLELGRRSFD